MARTVSLKELMEIRDASRTVKAYAFLNASLAVSEQSNNPTRDALDCFVPFVAAGISAQKGEQLDSKELQEYLRSHFSFEIPLYALDQFNPILEDQGHIKFEKSLSRYICTTNADDFLKQQSQTLSSFDGLEASISDFASSNGLIMPPCSSTWIEGLVKFLKGLPEDAPTKIVKIKDVMTAEGLQIEQYIIGRYISEINKTNQEMYAGILSVFKGVLIEDFIAGGLQVNPADKVHDFTAFYDTSLLLRLLGCSGSLLQDATLELHRYLQDIGCATEFLGVNESEVGNIISTLIGLKDGGHHIYGETGEAIERGEFSITSLRMLNNTFVEQLATLNVFDTRHSVNGVMNPQRFQIDEKGFEDTLRVASEKYGFPYSKENRQNDAQALGAVMMFRRGHRARDALRSRFIFVTDNRLLANLSRRYLIQERQLNWSDCPPILHVAQLTTIMWLLKHKRLEDKLVSRELLANCNAALKLDSEWLDKFMEAVGNAKSIKAIGGEKVLDDSIILQATRRIAQDQSFGRSAILQKLNIAEIIAKAQDEKEQFGDSRAELGRRMGVEQALEGMLTQQRDRARKWADRIVGLVEKAVITLVFLTVLVLPFRESLPRPLSIAVLIFGSVIALISALDLFGGQPVRSWFDRFRSSLADSIARILVGRD